MNQKPSQCMAVLAEKTPGQRTSQKTNFSKNGLNAENSQKLLFYSARKNGQAG